MDILRWLGIVFCISQSAMFSGLNLAFFSISKLRLEIESAKGDNHAIKVSKMREDSNFLLTTILWGNVGINVLLTLLSNSVMAGVVAFVFSTVLITFFGEIIPQAYFSRHAMKTASLLAPVLRFYQILLFPVAKTTAVALDKWLGAEAIRFFQEKDLRELLQIHIESPETDINRIEGKGALNFLAIDDLKITEEGELIDPMSVIEVPFEGDRPAITITEPYSKDPFLKKVEASDKKWVVLTDTNGAPRLTMDADELARAVFTGGEGVNILKPCHKPIVITDPNTGLGEAIIRLKVYPESEWDDVVDDDIILYWGEEEKRVITGADVLGRLLRGIVQHKKG